MNLIQQVNDQLNESEADFQAWSLNVDRLMEASDTNSEQLNEAVTHWLAKLRNVLGQGPLDPQKKQQAAYILGAIIALSDPNVADAFDEQEDLGMVLYSVSGDNPQYSKAALQRLIQIGRHPSVKSYLAQAEQALDDPQAATQLASQLQMKIDQVMQRKLSSEKTSTSAKVSPKLGLRNEIK